MKNIDKHYLFFDGSSKNNLGRAGAGVILLGGTNPVTFEWGLGKTSNNRAEAYGLLLGTTILKKRNIQNPIIMGDSAIIIQATINMRNPPNVAMGQIVKQITQNLANLVIQKSRNIQESLYKCWRSYVKDMRCHNRIFKHERLEIN